MKAETLKSTQRLNAIKSGILRFAAALDRRGSRYSRLSVLRARRNNQEQTRAQELRRQAEVLISDRALFEVMADWVDLTSETCSHWSVGCGI